MDTNKDFHFTISPLDFGLNMAWEHRKFFLRIGAMLMLADIAVYKLASDGRFLAPEQTLVFVPVINLLLVSFVLASAGILAITASRKGIIDFKQIVFSAASYLPKIFLSVVAICALMFFGATFIPLILIFFLWSPFLATADFYGKETETPDNKVRVKALKSEPDDYNPLDILIGTADDDDDEIMGKEPVFFDNSVTNLGLLRSFALSSNNFSSAVCSALVILLILSINAMLMIGAQFASENDAVSYITRIIASLSISFLSAVAAGSFIAILPITARKELKIKNLSEIVSPTYQIKTDTRFISTVIFLLILSMAGSYYLFNELKQIPESAEVTIVGTYVESGEAIIKLHITDEKRNFVWFVPNSFSVTWDVARNSSSADKLPRQLVNTVKTIPPTGFSVVDSANQPLQIIPQDTRQVTLSMRIPYTQGARNFELYYDNMFDVSEKKVFITKGSIKP